MTGGEHAKSELKSVAIFLAFGLGYTSIMHSVAAVYVLGFMDVFKQYADCVVCRPGEVNSQYDSEYCPLTSTPRNTMYNIARCQAVFDAIVLSVAIFINRLRFGHSVCRHMPRYQLFYYYYY